MPVDKAVSNMETYRLNTLTERKFCLNYGSPPSKSFNLTIIVVSVPVEDGN
jgi:hypothetical protein